MIYKGSSKARAQAYGHRSLQAKHDKEMRKKPHQGRRMGCSEAIRAQGRRAWTGRRMGLRGLGVTLTQKPCSHGFTTPFGIK